jgi:hypothetical protein
MQGPAGRAPPVYAHADTHAPAVSRAHAQVYACACRRTSSAVPAIASISTCTGWVAPIRCARLTTCGRDLQVREAKAMAGPTQTTAAAPPWAGTRAPTGAWGATRARQAAPACFPAGAPPPSEPAKADPTDLSRSTEDAPRPLPFHADPKRPTYQYGRQRAGGPRLGAAWVGARRLWRACCSSAASASGSMR